MSAWRVLELAALSVSIASIVWGALAFFVPPGRAGARAGLVAVTAASGFLNQVLVTWRSPVGPTRTAVAIIAYVASTWLFWSAVRACGTQRPHTIFGDDPPLRVIDGGPYRFIRHPFYASYTLFWMAGWIGTAAWSTMVVALVMTAIYIRAASSEEATFAASPMAAHYAAYSHVAGFFLPRLLTRRRSTGLRTHAALGPR